MMTRVRLTLTNNFVIIDRMEVMMRTDRFVQRVSAGRGLVLAGAGMLAVTGLMYPPGIPAQPQSASSLAFEVVSVKPHPAGDTRMQFPSFLPGGRLTSHAPLFIVIATAYNVAFQGPRLTGGPDWIRSADGVYDIEATPPKDALPQGLASNIRAERLRSMLQALLIDRFKLVIRRETKEMPVYTLTVGKGGPKLKKAEIEEKDCPDSDPSGPNDGKVYCHQISGGRGRGLHGQAVDMADIVKHVENWTDRPLLDQTGLHGLYQIDTKGWLPIQVGPPPAAGAKAEDGTDMADVLTVFQMFEKLGLKMEPQKDRAEIFVIEHIEKPTAN
jgi:uncharacterized protein (TIGR03435 family)